jgi:hypothetical protein
LDEKIPHSNYRSTASADNTGSSQDAETVAPHNTQESMQTDERIAFTSFLYPESPS